MKQQSANIQQGRGSLANGLMDVLLHTWRAQQVQARPSTLNWVSVTECGGERGSMSFSIPVACVCVCVYSFPDEDWM